MKKYYIMCFIPLVNIFVAKIWNYRCIKNNIPIQKQLFRGLIAVICCIPTVIIIDRISAFFQNQNIYYSLLYFAPAILNFVMVWLGRKDPNVTNTDSIGG